LAERATAGTDDDAGTDVTDDDAGTDVTDDDAGTDDGGATLEELFGTWRDEEGPTDEELKDLFSDLK